MTSTTSKRISSDKGRFRKNERSEWLLKKKTNTRRRTALGCDGFSRPRYEFFKTSLFFAEAGRNPAGTGLCDGGRDIAMRSPQETEGPSLLKRGRCSLTEALEQQRRFAAVSSMARSSKARSSMARSSMLAYYRRFRLLSGVSSAIPVRFMNIQVLTCRRFADPVLSLVMLVHEYS